MRVSVGCDEYFSRIAQFDLKHDGRTGNFATHRSETHTAMNDDSVAFDNDVEMAVPSAKDAGMTSVDPDETPENTLAEFVIADEFTLISTAKERRVDNLEEILSSFMAIVDKWDRLFADVDTTNVDALAQLAREYIYEKIDGNTYGVE